MTPLRPIPDLDPLTARDTAAALGTSVRSVTQAAHDGRFPGAFRTPSPGGYGHWRFPHAAVVKVAAELGVIR